MELKTINGEVADKTINSLKVNNFWIKFFKTNLIEYINIGDNVEIKYQDNK